ncbi:hypothetical protein BST36_30715, partial [Mycolicibacterium moriokaense]
LAEPETEPLLVLPPLLAPVVELVLPPLVEPVVDLVLPPLLAPAQTPAAAARKRVAARTPVPENPTAGRPPVAAASGPTVAPV